MFLEKAGLLEAATTKVTWINDLFSYGNLNSFSLAELVDSGITLGVLEITSEPGASYVCLANRCFINLSFLFPK